MKKILLTAGIIASMFSLTANAHTAGYKHHHHNHKKVIVKKYHHKHHNRHVVRHHSAR